MLHATQPRAGMKRKELHDDEQFRAAILQETASHADQYASAPQHHLTHPVMSTPYPVEDLNQPAPGVYRHIEYATNGLSDPNSYSQATTTDIHSTPPPISSHQHQQHQSHQPQDQHNAYSTFHLSDPQFATQATALDESLASEDKQDERQYGEEPSAPPRMTAAQRKAIQANANLIACTCCKKPRKFDSQEKLEHHRAEKQWPCLYCPNKFKNKNEAERHQNSLHRRNHSWSCSALNNDVSLVFFPAMSIPSAQSEIVGPEDSVIPSPLMTSSKDICGYCGIEFDNEPEPNWDARQHHVVTQHKFGECNQVKKFFRADHFRQHLKHSHGGKNGKHTNSLEAVCIRDEPPPQLMQDPNILSNGHQPSNSEHQRDNDAAIEAAVSLASQLPGAPIANMNNPLLDLPNHNLQHSQDHNQQHQANDQGDDQNIQREPNQHRRQRQRHSHLTSEIDQQNPAHGHASDPDADTEAPPIDMSNIDPSISFLQHHAQSSSMHGHDGLPAPQVSYTDAGIQNVYPIIGEASPPFPPLNHDSTYSPLKEEEP